MKISIQQYLALLGCVMIWLKISLGASATVSHIGIYPPVFEFSARPDSSINQTFTLSGVPGDQVTITTSELVPDGDLGYISSQEKVSQPEYIKWLQLGTKNFTFAGEAGPDGLVSRQVSFDIAVPKSASGDYYFVIYAENQGPKTKESIGTSVAESAKIGINILLTVTEEDLRVKPSANSVFDQLKPIYTNQPINFISRVENIGSVRFKTNGTVKVFAPGDYLVDESSLIPLNVLKESKRRLQNNLEREGELVVYTNIGGVLGIVLNNLPMVYTVMVDVVPDARMDVEAVRQQARFVYIPKTFIFLTLCVFGVAIFIILRRPKGSRNQSRETTNIDKTL